MEFTLSAAPPFSLYAVVRSHGWIRLSPFREIDDFRGLAYVGRLDSGKVLELQAREAPGGVRVAIDADMSPLETRQVEEMVDWMLGLDQSFSEFYRVARDEPKLAHVVEGAHGRVLRSPTLFEDTVKTILTTNTSWAGTIRMAEALVSQFGDPLLDDPSRHAFPTPEKVAQADEATLRSETGLGYRAPYVLQLARDVASGAVDLERLKTDDMPTPELRSQLLSIKGIGDYAAANLLMVLGRYDSIPVDSWAMKMVAHEWHAGEPIGRAEVEAAFESWGEWKGLAYWFWDWSYPD
jgi:3-methyladenine DNA glycosylase/8-oxoguanine DNA glycosylase